MIRRIVIVGGGLAGWAAANLLHHRLVQSVQSQSSQATAPPLQITVVASSQIGTIGVGESTTPLFTGLLRQLGIDEAELICEAGASYKLGVQFENWRGDGSQYCNPFGAPDQLPASTPPEFQYLAAWLLANGESLPDGILPHPGFMKAQRSPFLRDGQDLSSGRGAYALHIDAGRTADYLQARAVRLGVEFIDAEISSAQRDADSGFITALDIDGGAIEGDFFIDCSGFRRLLVGEVLDGSWESFSDHLLTDSALLIPKAPTSSQHVPPFTRAQAAPHGWIWQIPIHGRCGRGYVFRSEWLSPEQATVEAEQVLGEPVAPQHCLHFEPGAYRNPWQGNCVAVGLSAGFVEPLEATAIHATIVQLYALTAVLTPRLDLRAPVSEPYNREMRRFNRTVRDYLLLHYLGGRQDSEFWRQIAALELPDSLNDKLSVWKARLPIEGDFDGHWRLFGALQWMFVLQGVGLLNPQQAAAELADRGLEGLARTTHRRLLDSHQSLLARAVDHATLLKAVRGEPSP